MVTSEVAVMQWARPRMLKISSRQRDLRFLSAGFSWARSRPGLGGFQWGRVRSTRCTSPHLQGNAAGAPTVVNAARGPDALERGGRHGLRAVREREVEVLQQAGDRDVGEQAGEVLA